ncbi:shikimate kinase [Pulveribacter suum]|uniref:Shikimate kinase n=1 Tax=Pulveribacter suum TaxID=2116657 RepID=A0A2P1NHU8_9BURK|nr:shikimate kinase [Pulveribacter suum]AVP56615.1 shikimate kinase [Pulveribacter suum]
MQTRCALVGLPGSGKTTVGRHLARRLELPFIDLDQRLEDVLGSSIRQYFEECGEESFRDREQALLAELAAQPGPVVLSTGGGAVLRAANRAVLRSSFAQVFYLRATPEDLWRRLRHDRTRPLLQVHDPLGRLRELHQARDPLYREAAHFVIETGRPSVHTLVNMVSMQLEMAQRTTPQS